ncbi:hypothetical protein FO519_002244 [Halicephalobus sp. NKZ332]|nr:hypothetical protein FO519_002244 [Halicephalobus sp. NKZ332]
MAVRTSRRETYKSFWDKYSDKPDNGAMMLNKNADELEEQDRMDILASLPEFTDKDVVDIGAGIGRFTTIFSRTARHVTSTDFIHSFIEKNKERNATAKNIKFVVSDAAHLELSNRSVDLVFTNWLMMYMTDPEVVEFVTNALKWLRPGGFLKLRESCSEPSTGRKKTATLHTADVNPTSYRYSSLYIQLLKNVEIQEEDGSWWKFDLKWSASVPTYIQRLSNWRQVHWLAEKVPASSEGPHLTFDELIFGKSLKIPESSTVLAFNPRKTDLFLHIDSHAIAEGANSNVWTAETNCFAYRTALTKATETKDHRIRAGWNETFSEAVDYLQSNMADFDFFVASELFSEDRSSISKLPSILTKGAKLYLLEPADSKSDFEEKLSKLDSRFRVVGVEDVTSEAVSEIKSYSLRRNLDSGLFEKSLQKKWFFVEVEIN